MKKCVMYMIGIMFAGVCLFSGCTEQRELAQQQLAQGEEKDRYDSMIFAMDTVMNMTVYGEKGDAVLLEAEKEIQRLESLFSVTKENSEVAQLNARAGKESVPVSKETADLLLTGKALTKETENAFNITISPVVKAWGFTEETHVVPTQAKLDELMPLVDIEALSVEKDEQKAYLSKAGMAVDLGGIAKGYTTDHIMVLLREKGISSAVVSLGGNVATIGTKPDGSPWKVAVSNPLNTEDYVGMLEVKDSSVVTSGGYQRFFEENGKRYHHIINPLTGYPAESGLLSVTILSPDSTRADGLSTALFVMGEEKGLDFWRKNQNFEVIFITDDHRVVATKGAAEVFTFEKRDNDFTYEVVEK